MPARFLRRLDAVALLMALLTSNVISQTLGTVTGEISDTTGAAAAGATVTVRNTATNGVRVVTTNEEGMYSIPALVPM